MLRYCEVALPVPLRSTFTYLVSVRYDGENIVGRRVVVAFGKRAMIGVVLSESACPPPRPSNDSSRQQPPTPIKEIADLIDPVAALPPKLLGLGDWISHYY